MPVPMGKKRRRSSRPTMPCAGEGFSAHQALLPDDLRNFDGYRLLQEYFAFPARFLFISLHGLRPMLAQSGEAKSFDIIILLDKADGQLERVVDKTHLALHCTPVVNLFPKIAERQKLSDNLHEYHLVVDNIRPLDYEIYAVTKIHASVDGQRDEQTFRPFWSSWSRGQWQLWRLFLAAPRTARAF